MTTKVDNLDAVPPDVLMEIARGEIVKREVRLDLTPREITMSHLKELYARVKFRAIALRAQGDISDSLRLEAACENIYWTLPADTRW